MATRAQIEAIFRIDNGYFPNSTNVLEALLQPPAGATNWRGPYLMAEAGITNDTWGTPFRFFVPGYHNTNSFDIISAGPDRRLYTEDDIGNWRFNIVAGHRTNL